MKIKEIHVFGHRCSGTNYAQKLLANNLREVSVESSTIGWKHSDVGSEFKEIRNGKVKPYKMRRLKDPNSTLLIVTYRNPISWILSLNLRPYHAPLNYNLEINQFLAKPWRAYYCEPGVTMKTPESRKAAAVKKNLTEAYDDIFHLRQDKINMFEGFRKRFPNVCYANLEYIESNPEEFTQKVASEYSIKKKDKFTPDIHERHSQRIYKKKPYKDLTADNIRYILSKVDVEVEARIGYKVNLMRKIILNVLPGDRIVKDAKGLFVSTRTLRIYSQDL